MSVLLQDVGPYKLELREGKIPGFPCTECHDHYVRGYADSKELAIHHPTLNLKHMPEVQKCIFCHSASSLNLLNLLDGKLVSYDQSFKLCEQCHGSKTYDWKRGLHGSISGHWNGERTIVNCTSCHDAHSPSFKPMEATKPPEIPKFHIDKKEGEH